ncbi:class I SAM-dependent methyltransferase [Glutamicibacter sp. X7]
MHQHQHSDAVINHQDFWEQHYGAAQRIWSGRVNPQLAELAGALPAGRSVDLGCGEGADVHWLAARGWEALGVDISATAIERARAVAAEHELSTARFTAADLTVWTPNEHFDLVTASFLQAPFEFSRSTLLRRASELVAPGGHLLLVSHGSRPQWAPQPQGGFEFPTLEDELRALALDEQRWELLVAERRTRELTGPQGQPGTTDDNVIFARRR